MRIKQVEVYGVHTAVVTAADSVTPDASFTSPLLAVNQHCRGDYRAHMRLCAQVYAGNNIK